MPCNRREDKSYLDMLLKQAIKGWDPAKPRRWLARHGGLHILGIGNSDLAQRYSALQTQAVALTRRDKRPESTGSLPDLIYPNW